MALSISHRCLNIAPSLTLQIDTRAKEMAASGMNVIGFGAGEPDFPTPQHICEAAKEALDLGMTRYTAVPGTMELRMLGFLSGNRPDGRRRPGFRPHQ